MAVQHERPWMKGQYLTVSKSYSDNFKEHVQLSEYLFETVRYVRGLSCQQSNCNLLSLYKLIIIIPFILPYNFYSFHPHHV